jgi:hypothetical protein
MKSVVALIGVGILIIFLGAIMTALGAFRGENFTEPHAITAPATSENVVLANDILDDATTNVTLISDVTSDNLVPYAYASTTRQLTINGIDDSETGTHTITITYKVPRLDDATDTIAKFFPLFLILGGIGCIVGAGFEAYHNARG